MVALAADAGSEAREQRQRAVHEAGDGGQGDPDQPDQAARRRPRRRRRPGPTLTVDQFREHEDPGDPEDRRRADQQDAAPDHGHRGRRSAEAGLLVPPRRALRREAALQLQRGARARSEDLRAAAATSAARCRRSRRRYEQQEQKWLLEAVKAFIAATKFREVRAHGRGAVPPRVPAHQREEGRPGARVLPPPDQGLPELEVHPGRVPVVRRVLLRQGRDGERAQVLREGRAVPEVAASTPTPSTRRGGATSTWATTRPRSRPSSASSA